MNRLRLSFNHIKERKFGHNFADTIRPFVHFVFLFPWNWNNFPFFLLCRNSTIHRTTLVNELSNVSSTTTSLKQNDLPNVILYEDKNFDSHNNQSIMGTKTLTAIAINVYSPQPSILSDTLNDLRSHFLSNSINNSR